MSIIQLENVSLRYADHSVLENIQLQIAKGECLVLIGPSGQGKTSLLKMMSGLVSPSNGRVFVEQKDLITLSRNERAELVKRMGMLFQRNALFDSLTCAENIAFPLREASSLLEQEIQRKVESSLEEVGLSASANLYPDEISGGMQKRLGIARALALAPEIIFYDDPTAGLDPITSRKIIELILKLKCDFGSTVVAVTNDMNRAYQMADRIAMVIDREVLVTGTPEETRLHPDPRVHQFVRGDLRGPLSVDLGAEEL